ncbi:MAG: hypothetical protein WA154_06425 [Moraxellaceae bacterium]
MKYPAYSALAACIALGYGNVAVAKLSAPIAAAPVVSTNITEADVLAAQQAWGNALVKIATDYDEGGIAKAKATAEAVLDAAYGYNMGAVLFKPTLAVAPQTFRPTKEGALAYFVGNNPKFPNDKGFALKGWRSFSVTNSAIQLHGNTAMSIGNVSVTDKAGKTTTVDKTWGYVRDDQGNLRIVLHHSSLPYQP